MRQEHHDPRDARLCASVLIAAGGAFNVERTAESSWAFTYDDEHQPAVAEAFDIRPGPRDVPERTWALEHADLRQETKPARGEPYTHRCSIETYAEITHWINEREGKPFTTTTAWSANPEIPSTQIAVALAFLRERGVIERCEKRQLVATSGDVHLDGMTELYALDPERTTGAAT